MYLLLWAELGRVFIKEENDEVEMKLEDKRLNLPQSLIDEINAWNEEYEKYIPNPEAHVKEMNFLDKKGGELAKKIKNCIPDKEAKIEYVGYTQNFYY